MEEEVEEEKEMNIQEVRVELVDEELEVHDKEQVEEE